MTTEPLASSSAAPTLPATLTLGPVHLTVTDLDRSVSWYQRSLGMRVHRHDVTEAALGVGDGDVVVLHEDARARPAGRHAGLFHYALLFPSREELARAVVRLAHTGTPMTGASDHVTHEAVYLPDPDGNGIELAADRPRARWPTPEQAFAGGPAPLDMDGLLASVDGEAPAAQAAAGLIVGHVHLHVGDVAEGLAFYRDVLGFELYAQLPTAAFVSAGGYHHHVAFNVWRGAGVPPAPADTVGLRHWTIVIDSAEQVADVRARLEAAGVRPEADGAAFTLRDPWEIALRVEPRA